ncbi:MAG: hypothetical protein U5K69_01270 [Balneolaceae bacterium]|nr:hypothetical protein [Balneolaceae bacterium]
MRPAPIRNATVISRPSPPSETSRSTSKAGAANSPATYAQQQTLKRVFRDPEAIIGFPSGGSVRIRPPTRKRS